MTKFNKIMRISILMFFLLWAENYSLQAQSLMEKNGL